MRYLILSLIALLFQICVPYPSTSIAHQSISEFANKPLFTFLLSSVDNEYFGRANALICYQTKYYFSTREGIFLLDKEKKSAILFIDGMQVNNPTDKAFTRLVIHKNKLYAAGLFTGIFCLDNKTNKWVLLNKGMTDTTFFDLISCNGVLYAPAYDDGLFYLNESNNTWLPVKGEMAKGTVNCGCLNNTLWVGTNRNELFRFNESSRELRRNVQFKKPETYENSIISIGITGLFNQNDTLYAGGHVLGMFKSTDNGKTWLRDKSQRIKFVLGTYCNLNGRLLISDYWGYNIGLYELKTQNDSMIKIDLGLKEKKIEFITTINDTLYLSNKEGIWEMPVTDFEKYYLPQ